MATGSKAKGNYRPMAMLMYASAQRAGSVKRVLPKDQGQKAVTKESMIAPPVLVTEATVTDKLIQLHRYIQCHPITSIYIQILYTYMPCNWQWPILHIRFDGCFWLSLWNRRSIILKFCQCECAIRISRKNIFHTCLTSKSCKDDNPTILERWCGTINSY